MTDKAPMPLTDDELKVWKNRAHSFPNKTAPKWDLDRRYIATIESLQRQLGEWKTAHYELDKKLTAVESELARVTKAVVE